MPRSIDEWARDRNRSRDGSVGGSIVGAVGGKTGDGSISGSIVGAVGGQPRDVSVAGSIVGAVGGQSGGSVGGSIAGAIQQQTGQSGGQGSPRSIEEWAQDQQSSKPQSLDDGQRIYEQRKQAQAEAQPWMKTLLWLGEMSEQAEQARLGQQIRLQEGETTFEDVKDAWEASRKANRAADYAGRDKLIEEYNAARHEMGAQRHTPEPDVQRRYEQARDRLYEQERIHGNIGLNANGELQPMSYSRGERVGNVIGGVIGRTIGHVGGAAVWLGEAAARSEYAKSAAHQRELAAFYAMVGNDNASEGASRMADTLTQRAAQRENLDEFRGAYEFFRKQGRVGNRLIQAAKENQRPVVQMGVDVGSTALEMGFDAVSGSPLVSMGVRVFGGASQEAREAGAGFLQQGAYGAASASIEVMTEMIGGLKLYGGGQLDEVLEPALREVAGTPGGYALLRAMYTMAQEGNEEVLSDLLQPLAQSIYNGKSVGENYSELELQDILYDWLLGAAAAFGGTVLESGGYAQDYTAMREMQQDLNAQGVETGRMTDEQLRQAYTLDKAGVNVAGLQSAENRAVGGETIGEAYENMTPEQRQEAVVNMLTANARQVEQTPTDEITRETAQEILRESLGEREAESAERILDLGSESNLREQAIAYHTIATEYGQTEGRSVEDAMRSNVRGALNDAQVQHAYAYGESLRKSGQTVGVSGQITEQGAQTAKPVRRAGLVTAGTFADGSTTYKAADLSKADARDLRILNDIAKAQGVDIVLYETELGEADAEGRRRYIGANGAYRNGVVYLDINAGLSGERTEGGKTYSIGQRALLVTAAHELTHHLEHSNPTMYRQLRSFVTERLGGSDSYIGYVKDAMARENIGVEAASREVVARACEEVLLDEDAIRELQGKKPTLWEQIKEWVKDFVKKFESPSGEAVEMRQYADELRRLWLGAAKEAQESAGGTADVVFAEGAAKQTGSGADISHSLRENGNITARTMAYLGKHPAKHISEDMIETANGIINEMTDYMLPYLDKDNNLGRHYLPEEVLGTTIFSDSSYGKSVENTTICFRTLAYIDFTNEIKKRIGRPLTVQESFLASQMLYDIAKEPQCLYCYVSLDRKAYDEFLGKYLKQRDGVLKAFGELSSEEQTKIVEALRGIAPEEKGAAAVYARIPLYAEFLKDESGKKRKNTAPMRQRFGLWISTAAGGKGFITAKDLTTAETRNALKEGELAEQVLDAERYAQAASWAKKLEEYRAYNGNILNMSQETVDKLNESYGLRFYSFSEYSAAFIVENMQQIRDAAAKGLYGLAYTKKPDFARIFAGTGININISTFGRWGVDAQGKRVVVMDDLQGANWDEVKQLRDDFKNVGAVFVATDDAMVDWALAQDWIDVVIPFHIVRTGADVANFYKWVVHNQDQADKTKKGKAKDITPPEHQNDRATFLALAKERGLTPRFSKWLGNEHYMKLVNETRQPTKNSTPLKPVFDLKAAKQSFDDFVDEGGYYGNWYKEKTEQTGPVAYSYEEAVDQVVSDVKAGRKANEVSYGRQDIDVVAENFGKARQNAPRAHGQAMGPTVQRSVRDFTSKGAIDAEIDRLQAEYDEAFAEQNEDWMKQIVAQAAYEAGYTTGAYHGSPVKDITEFRTRSSETKKQTMQLLFGTHFTQNRDYAAIYAKKAKNSKGTTRMTAKGDGRVYDVYLDLGKSLDLQTAKNYAPGSEMYELYEDMPDAIRKRIPPHTFTEADTREGLGSGKFVTAAIIEKCLQTMSPKMATDLLVSHGYNSVKYLADYSTAMANNRMTRDPSIIMLDPERIKSGDAVTYDDNGEVIPLSQRFDSGKNDIRFSVRSDAMTDRDILMQAAEEYGEESKEKRESIANLKAENKILRARAEYWKGQTRQTRERTVRQQDTDRLANDLLRRFDSRADKESVKQKIRELGNWLVQNDADNLSYDELHDRARSIAEEIVGGNYTLIDDSQAEAGKRFRDYLKGTPVKLTAEDWSDTGDEGFRRRYGRYFTVSERGRTLDSLWGELAATFGDGAFPEDIYAPGDMLNMIGNYIDTWKPRYGNVFEANWDEAVDAAAGEIIDRVLGEEVRQTPATFADKAQQKLNAQIAKDKANLDALREAKNARIEDLKQQTKENNSQLREFRDAMASYQNYDAAAQEHLQKLGELQQERKTVTDMRTSTGEITPQEKQQRLDALDKQIASERKEATRAEQNAARALSRVTQLEKGRALQDILVKERAAQRQRTRDKANERLLKRDARKVVEKRAKALYDMLMKNSDKQHVPEMLKEPLGAFLEGLDFSSNRLLAGGEETKRDAKFGAALQKISTMLNEQQAWINGDENAKNGDFGAFLDISSENLQFLKGCSELVTQALSEHKSYTVNQMSGTDLKALGEFLQNLTTAVRNMNNFMANARFESVREAAKADIEHMNALGKAAETAGSGLSKTAMWDNGVPYYVLKRFGEGSKAIFDSFAKGWEKMAFNAKEIIDFTAEAYTTKEVNAWKSEMHDFTLEDGSEIRMTTAQIMALSALIGREQAMKHIEQGGIRIGDIKTAKGEIHDTTHYHLTAADISAIVGSLTERQAEVAGKLQKFMAKKGAEWGNEVSMKRFGYRFYTEGDAYYPIKTDSNDRPMADTDAQENSMFRLLNLSSSKSLNPNASNALIVDDIFDTFADHMADMAKLNGMGLPVLDAIKWFNYKERIDRSDGTYDTKTLQGAMEQAFGKQAQRYFSTLMKDINGLKESGDRGGEWQGKLISNYKVAAVGANLRVMLLQPTSYVRALTLIKPRYLAGALFSKNAYKEALKYSGTAVWKALGYYDTNISRSMREQIQHSDSFGDQVKEISMTGAEFGDKWTWGGLWTACKMQTRAETKLSGEELNRATADLFRNVIYSSQVMDSTLTRSQSMRASGKFTKLKTAFMAEPTLSYNILLDAYSQTSLDIRKYGRSEGWKRNTGKMAHAFAVYAISASFSALVESFVDALRDDDDEEFVDKFLDALIGEVDKAGKRALLKGNLMQDLTIIGKIPELKDLISFFQGHNSRDMSVTAIGELKDAYEVWRETVLLQKGILDKATKTTYYGNMTLWGKIYKTLTALSHLSGYAVSNLTRDALSLWNTFVPSMKIKTYEGRGAAAQAQRYIEAYRAGDRDKMQEIVFGVGTDKSGFNSQISAEIRAEYMDGDISEAQAIRMLKELRGLSNLDAQDKLREWEFEKTQGYAYDKLKQTYLGGDVSEAQAMKFLRETGDKTQGEAERTMREWNFEKTHGYPYSDLKARYVDGKVSQADTIRYVQEVTLKGLPDVQETVLHWQCLKDTGIDYDKIDERLQGGDITLDRAAGLWQKYGGMSAEDATLKANYVTACGASPGLKDKLTQGQYKAWYNYARSAGVKVEVYADIRSTANTDEQSNINQPEAAAAITRALNTRQITRAQAEAVWKSFNKGWTITYADYVAKH